MAFDFNLEMKLMREAPELHRIFSDNVLCSQNMLNKYKSFFPNYTDHTSLHSLEVIAFCNELVGDYIDELNVDEIFILLTAIYLHDSGMGISLSDWEIFVKELPKVQKYISENPSADTAETIRRFHNDFSGKYIEKYRAVFDFPSDEYLFAVIQVARGHRVTDLYDEREYPSEYKLPNGNVVRLPYLASLIRLADELDIAADRNIQFLYDVSNVNNKESLIEFYKHKAIKQVEFRNDSFFVVVDYSDEKVNRELDKLFDKFEKTLNYCVDVVKKRTPFRINQTKIVFERI